jgi:hypothetical protein
VPIKKLEAEHIRILEKAEALERVVSGPRPATPDTLLQIRWNFTREVLTHFSIDETLVLLPLMGDRRPHIAQLAAQSRSQLRALYDDFETHMEQWAGLPSAEDWPSYCRGVHSLMRRLRARIAAEEIGLHHFLPVQRGERPVPDKPTDYADKAWKIREHIHAAPRSRAATT